MNYILGNSTKLNFANVVLNFETLLLLVHFLVANTVQSPQHFVFILYQKKGLLLSVCADWLMDEGWEFAECVCLCVILYWNSVTEWNSYSLSLLQYYILVTVVLFTRTRQSVYDITMLPTNQLFQSGINVPHRKSFQQKNKKKWINWNKTNSLVNMLSFNWVCLFTWTEGKMSLLWTKAGFHCWDTLWPLGKMPCCFWRRWKKNTATSSL